MPGSTVLMEPTDELIWFAKFIPPTVKSAGAMPTVPVAVRVVEGGDT